MQGLDEKPSCCTQEERGLWWELLPHAQPVPCSSPVCGSLPASCCLLGWAGRGTGLWGEVVLQDWPELLILAAGIWCSGHWRPAGGEKGRQSWESSSVSLWLAQLYYICEINHAFILHGNNRDLCMLYCTGCSSCTCCGLIVDCNVDCLENT